MVFPFKLRGFVLRVCPRRHHLKFVNHITEIAKEHDIVFEILVLSVFLFLSDWLSLSESYGQSDCLCFCLFFFCFFKIKPIIDIYFFNSFNRILSFLSSFALPSVPSSRYALNILFATSMFPWRHSKNDIENNLKKSLYLRIVLVHYLMA